MEDFKKEYEEEFEDVDFEEVDALIDYLNELPKSEVFLINYPRIEQMRFSCAMLNKVLREAGCDVKIECKKHEFEQSVGVVRVEGVSIDIVDLEGFARAAEFATNTEVYALTNGKVKFTFTFYDLLVPMR